MQTQTKPKPKLKTLSPQFFGEFLKKFNVENEEMKKALYLDMKNILMSKRYIALREREIALRKKLGELELRVIERVIDKYRLLSPTGKALLKLRVKLEEMEIALNELSKNAYDYRSKFYGKDYDRYLELLDQLKTEMGVGRE